MTRITHWLLLVLLPALFGLGGCSLIDFKSDTPPVTHWRLQADPPPPSAERPLPFNLVVNPVYVAPGLEGDALMILDPPSRYDFIRNAAWPTDLPDYLRRQLILDLAGTGHYASVLRSARSDLPNRMLLLRVSDFQLERRAEGLRAHLRIEAGMWDLKGKGMRLHRWYEVSEPVAELRMAAVSAAWNRAWGRFLARLVPDIDRALQDGPLSPQAGR